MIFLFIFSILSFLGLWLSANWIVNSSSKIASYFGISSLVIGLTIVSFGTSAPEFAVSLSAALSGNSDISVSNIVGSNIFNLGFILGSVALFCPISTSLILLKRDCSVLIFSSFLLLVFLRDGLLSRAEGILFIFFLIGYLFLLFFSKREEKSNKETKDLIKISDFIFLILGLVLISISSKVLIHCSSSLALQFGISEWAIGVTLIAAGTSLPEFVTSLIAAIKKNYGISIGNLIGSDIFNLLGVLGLASTMVPLSIGQNYWSSIVVLFFTVILVSAMVFTGWQISRKEGIVLIVLNSIRWYYDFV